MARDEAKKLFEEGIRLFEERKYTEAIDAYDKALAIDPKDAFAWNSRGNALYTLGHYQEAVESYDKALAIDSQDVITWILRGFGLEQLGRLQEVVENCDKALAISRDAVLVWSFRGDALLKLERHQEAAESYEEALKHNPHCVGAWEGKIEALDLLEEWLKAHRPSSPFVEMYKLVVASEERLHAFIRQRLQRHFGKDEAEWWAKGIPQPIRKKCADRREEDPQRGPIHTYTDLIDLKEIIDKNWEFFEKDFRQVKGQVSSKKEFLDGLVRLNEIRKLVMHPVRSAPTEDDRSFAHKMREVIGKFANPG